MTTLSKDEKQAMMADMKSFDEPMPAVGIFGYDSEKHDLFEVHKKELTPKMIEDSLQQGTKIIDYSNDYAQAASGRVLWDTNKFIVFVGQWAKDCEDELTELINRYFALPYFEYRYDEHWDLGHGWSGDL